MENHQKILSSYLSYLPSSDNPLSAEVFFIKGNESTYIYDVGANDESLRQINQIKNKKIILSHFHQDHTANIHHIAWEKLYVDKKTCNYMGKGDMVNEKIEISDGVTLEIIPTVTSHSKIALLLNVNYEYLLTGDALYSIMVDGKEAYNVQLLKETIATLKVIKTKKVVLSHDSQLIYPVEEILAELEGYYSKREKDNPFIFIK